MAILPNPINGDLKRGFTVPQVAEKYGCNKRGTSLNYSINYLISQ